MSIFGILEYFWTFYFHFYIINRPEDLKNLLDGNFLGYSAYYFVFA